MVERYQPLTDSQWQVIAPLLPLQRKRRLCPCAKSLMPCVVCAAPAASGAACRLASPWSAVYYYFARWQTDGTFQRFNEASNRADRLARNRLPTPSPVLVDAQSVKLAPRPNQRRGLDARKRVNGRKRQVLCDTSGRIWRVHVHAANGHDSRAAQPLLPRCDQPRPARANRLRIVPMDSACQGRFAQQVQALGWQHEVASRPPSAVCGFVPVAKRWVVERTSPDSTAFDASSWIMNVPRPVTWHGYCSLI